MQTGTRSCLAASCECLFWTTQQLPGGYMFTAKHLQDAHVCLQSVESETAPHLHSISDLKVAITELDQGLVWGARAALRLQNRWNVLY